MEQTGNTSEGACSFSYPLSDFVAFISRLNEENLIIKLIRFEPWTELSLHLKTNPLAIDLRFYTQRILSYYKQQTNENLQCHEIYIPLLP